MLTPKEFKLLAAIINSVRLRLRCSDKHEMFKDGAHEALKSLAVELALQLGSRYPNFVQARFIAACGFAHIDQKHSPQRSNDANKA